MDDQGFDFRRAPERRAPKRFEPPPWEQEAFEAIRSRAEGEPADEPVAEKAVADRSAEAPPVTTPETEPVARSVESEKAEGPSEAELIEMLAELAEEETDLRTSVFNVTMAVSIALIALGSMLLMWSMAALAKAGQAAATGVARTGAITIALFGAGFLGSAVWLLYRMLKQRGVL